MRLEIVYCSNGEALCDTCLYLEIIRGGTELEIEPSKTMVIDKCNCIYPKFKVEDFDPCLVKECKNFKINGGI